MCKELEDLWAEAIEEDGKKREAKVKAEERLRSIIQIMQNMHYSIEEAMQVLGIPAEEKNMYLAMI